MRYIGLGLVFTLCFASCKKKSVDPFSYEGRLEKNSGIAIATINEKPWNSTITFTSLTNGKLIIDAGYYESGLLRQSIVIYNIDLSKKDQKIFSRIIPLYDSIYTVNKTDSVIAAFYLSDDDAAENSYDVIDSNFNNYLHIDSYNAATGQIIGSFQVAFFRYRATYKIRTQGFPDTLRITDGKFSVRLMNYN